MKLLLLLTTVALLVWLVRRDLGAARARAARKETQTPARPAAPEAMVRCAACGLHLPAGDALPAPDGRRYYCCAAHRQQAAS